MVMSWGGDGLGGGVASSAESLAGETAAECIAGRGGVSVRGGVGCTLGGARPAGVTAWGGGRARAGLWARLSLGTLTFCP